MPRPSFLSVASVRRCLGDRAGIIAQAHVDARITRDEMNKLAASVHKEADDARRAIRDSVADGDRELEKRTADLSLRMVQASKEIAKEVADARVDFAKLRGERDQMVNEMKEALRGMFEEERGRLSEDVLASVPRRIDFVLEAQWSNVKIDSEIVRCVAPEGFTLIGGGFDTNNVDRRIVASCAAGDHRSWQVEVPEFDGGRGGKGVAYAIGARVVARLREKSP